MNMSCYSTFLRAKTIGQSMTKINNEQVMKKYTQPLSVPS